MQAILTYAIIAAAALFVVWNIVLPRPLKRSIRARFAGRVVTPVAGCGPDGCGNCGDP